MAGLQEQKIFDFRGGSFLFQRHMHNFVPKPPVVAHYDRNMKNRKRWFIGSLVILAAAAFLLITGSSILVISISRTPFIPLGTFITWLGLISLPLSIYSGIGNLRDPSRRIDKYFASILTGLIILSVLWAPICYFLAGNFSFSFTEKGEFQGGQLAMSIFWYFSYFMAAAPVMLWIIYGIISFLRKRK